MVVPSVSKTVPMSRPSAYTRVRSISSVIIGTRLVNGVLSPLSSGRVAASARNASATSASASKSWPASASSWSCQPPTAPSPGIGGGGAGRTVASGIDLRSGAARMMIDRTFSVAGSRSSHGFSVTITTPALVDSEPVRKFRPLIWMASATASSRRTISWMRLETSCVRRRLDPGGSW